MAVKYAKPKGTQDILPEASGSWLYLEERLRRTVGLYGYREIRLPTFEHTEVFARGVGEACISVALAKDGEVILKKYSPIGEISNFAKDYTESLFRSLGHIACITDNSRHCTTFIHKNLCGNVQFNTLKNVFQYFIVLFSVLWHNRMSLHRKIERYSMR